MKFELELTMDHFKEFNQFASYRILKNKGYGYFEYIFHGMTWFVILVVIVSIVHSLSNKTVVTDWNIATLLVSTPFFIYVCARNILDSRVSKDILPNEDGLILGHKIIEFNDDGIRENVSFGSSFYKYESIEAIEENEGNVYLLTNSWH